MSVSKKILIVCLPFLVLSCKPKKEVPEVPPIPSEVALASVSDSCLNLEKLAQVLQAPEFSVPAALMTTNLKPISTMPQAKLNYFSYATFNYRTSTVNELGLFNEVRQKDCKTVQMLSASEEVLTFDVISSTDKEISIKLKDKFRDTMNAAQQTAMFERQQPTELTYKYIDPHHVVIVEKYSTVDPLCTSKTPLTFQIEKDLYWASRPNELPKLYGIDPQYLNQVKETLTPEAAESQVAAFATPESVPVESIKIVMRSPVKEELKLCTQ